MRGCSTRIGTPPYGVRVVDGQEVVIRDVYTYNQGTVLRPDDARRRGGPDRAALLVDAVNRELTTGGRRSSSRTAATGLFTGILARYLALMAADPGVDVDTAARARRLVGATADGFWAGRAASSAGSRFPVGATEPPPWTGGSSCRPSCRRG